ncbi:MAG: GNAT family N-acetyltransferase [Tenericutes bacterium]|nr:GNAT family N-acetyltransferase [Mycoplasmatota bacterium]
MNNKIKQVTNVVDADRCDELLTKLIQDERQYNDTIDDNYIVTNHFNQMLDDENIIILAYYINKTIVGYILIRKMANNTCLLDGLYVEKEYRNKGIGKSLLTEAISRIKNMNVKYVDINVMYNNIIAKHIYEKLGFVGYEIKMRKSI